MAVSTVSAKCFQDITSSTSQEPLSKARFAKAQQIFTALQNEIVCSEDIIKTVEGVPSSVNAEQVPGLLKKFGEVRFIKLMKFQRRLKVAGEVIELALTQHRSDIKFPSTSKPLAIAKFEVGLCQEASNRAASKLVLEGFEVCTIVTRKPGFGKENHGFLVFGEEGFLDDLPKFREAIKRGQSCTKVLPLFERGVIFDRFLLSELVAAKDIGNCREFMDYFQATGREEVYMNQPFGPENRVHWIASMREAAFLYEKALPSFEKALCDSPTTLILQSFEPNLVAKRLMELIPNTLWKSDKIKVWHKAFWFEIGRVVNYLKAHQIAFESGRQKEEGVYAVILREFDLIQIDALPQMDFLENIKALVSSVIHARPASLEMSRDKSTQVSDIVVSYL